MNDKFLDNFHRLSLYFKPKDRGLLLVVQDKNSWSQFALYTSFHYYLYNPVYCLLHIMCQYESVLGTTSKVLFGEQFPLILEWVRHKALMWLETPPCYTFFFLLCFAFCRSQCQLQHSTCQQQLTALQQQQQVSLRIVSPQASSVQHLCPFCDPLLIIIFTAVCRGLWIELARIHNL